MLSPYRVLDLTDEKGYLCGRLLGDLGAAVIKVEPPSGDAGRNIGPFYHDDLDKEKSLFWFSQNFNKKGITLNIETSDGREILKQLVKSADILVESFRPGYLDDIGLGYLSLRQFNPLLVLTSITPFGQCGPYKDYKSSDIVSWAMGGALYISGDVDRPPVRISYHPQSYLHAGAEAAAASMLALYARVIVGEGQHVDIPIQQCVEWVTHRPHTVWDMNRELLRRGGRRMRTTAAGVTLTNVWPCKDGAVGFYLFAGFLGKIRNPALVKWISSEDMSTKPLDKIDWETFGWDEKTQDLADRLEEPIGKFFMKHTKQELYEGALERGIMLYPVATAKDILDNPQLKARNYWVEVVHPELNDTITYPGAWAKMSENPIVIRQRAPLIGEHNYEIYQGELGLSRHDLIILKQNGIV